MQPTSINPPFSGGPEGRAVSGAPREEARPSGPPLNGLGALARFVTVIAIVAGLVLRWFGLGRRSLWFDEGYTAWVVSLRWREVIRVIKADTAPPLFYLLLHGWTQIFGRSETALRSLSALMASVSLIVFVLVARRVLLTAWGRAIAISLFSLSFMQIAYAHEARLYAMMAMLGVIDLYLVLLACEKMTVLRCAALMIAWGISLYINNMMAVYLACLGIAWLIIPGNRSIRGRIADIAIVATAAALLYLPWLPTMLQQSKRLQAGFWPDVPDIWTLLRTIGVMTGVHEQSMSSGAIEKFLRVYLLLGILAALAGASWRNGRMVLALLVFGLVPIRLIYVYSTLKQSIFMERAFLVSSTVMPLLITLAMESVRTKLARSVAIGGALWFLWLNVWSIPNRFLGEQTEGWREASAYAAAPDVHPGVGRLTVFVSNEGEILYDYYQRGSDYSSRGDLMGEPRGFFDVDPPRTLAKVTIDGDLAELRRRLDEGKFSSVVLICSHSWWGDHDQRTLFLLSDRLRLIQVRQFEQIKVFKFTPK